MNQVLDIKNFTLSIHRGNASRSLLNKISLSVKAGEVMGLVGESGSGKSLTAFASLGFLPSHDSIVEEGTVSVDGKDIFSLPKGQLRRLRGSDAAIIFQEPMTALNPIRKIGWQIEDILWQHQKLKKKAARSVSLELFKKMNIRDPARAYEAMPFELSGGMRQRILIAMAFACSPKLILADEITTALDVTVEKQILELLRQRVAETNVGVLFISHDLQVIHSICNNVAVMYQGQIVETGPAEDLLKAPQHPYTKMLVAARPRRVNRKQHLNVDTTSTFISSAPSEGCIYAPRCPWADDQCMTPPPLQKKGPRTVQCWKAGGKS